MNGAKTIAGNAVWAVFVVLLAWLVTRGESPQDWSHFTDFAFFWLIAFIVLGIIDFVIALVKR